MKATIVCCLVLLVLFSSCRKSESLDDLPGNPQTSEGSSHTAAMCGTRSFHNVVSGYNPSQRVYFSDTTDINAVINYVDDATVSFRNETYIYDSTSASGLVKYHYATPYPYESGYIHFDHFANTVVVYRNTHISAGAGNWSYSYYSF